MVVPTDAARLAARTRPATPWILRQRWRRLLFLHWKVDPSVVQADLPPGLYVDVHKGSAWVGVVPFAMRGVRPRYCPPVPWISNFLELNVRTYVVDAQGRPGVWFYSLDANRRLAVALAQGLFHLPYLFARITAERVAGHGYDFRCRRPWTPSGTRLAYSAQDGVVPAPAAPGSLEFFLVERYRLFTQDPGSGILLTGRVWHEPYRIAPANVIAWDDRPLILAGLELEGAAFDHACVSPGVDVEVYPLQPVAAPVSDPLRDDGGLTAGPLPA